MRYLKFVILIFLFAAGQAAFGQVYLKELPRQNSVLRDSLFYGLSRTRSVIHLNDKWVVYLPKESDNRTYAAVPSNFKGAQELVYEKYVRLSPWQVNNCRLQLVCLGVNYSAEISINNYAIYRHTGGDFPINIDLPKDILKSDKSNKIVIKVLHKFDSETTIPVVQKFLFPESRGGMIRDAYILVTPKNSISSLDFKYHFQGNQHVRLSINSKVLNSFSSGKGDTSSASTFSLKASLISPRGGDASTVSSGSFMLSPRREKAIGQSFDITGPDLWNPSHPVSYSLKVQLYRGDQLIDEIVKPVAFYNLVSTKDSLMLNGESFRINGTTYYASNYDYANMISYNKMRDDIKAIKDLGINAIRFAKQAPNPYYLELCREYGILAFIEVPLNSIPDQICSKANFKDRVKVYLGQFLRAYDDYSAVAAIGLGSSYLSNSECQQSFIGDLAGYVKSVSGKLTYASFVGFKTGEINNLDLYGVELLNNPMDYYTLDYSNLAYTLGNGKLFISEATYSSYMGGTSGYLNPFSCEAQAKFFSDLLDYVAANNASGYFINSMFDYRGDVSSLVAGYNPENIYKTGILGEDRQINRLSYKVIQAKLSDGEKVTIPIGSKRDDAPLVFIIYGLGVGLLMGFLVNAKRKFREDATRALLRPYNFYADIRDQRILAGFNSNFLMIILAGCSALLIESLLFFLRANVLFDKALLAFNFPAVAKFISYLAWNPAEGLAWTTVLSFAGVILITLFSKIGSLFIRNRVFFSSIYYAVVWSFLPLLLLLPVAVVLYKILSANAINTYIYGGLVVFTIWVFYRLMKGIYVIFDVAPSHAYFWSILVIVLVVSGVLVYFQFTDSTVYYLINAYKQYKLM
jgi:beta-galactosidase